MTNTGNNTFTATLTGQVDASVITFSGRFPYEGGLVRTKDFNYTVGEDCILGLEDLNTAKFNVYPNPTENIWNVKTSNSIINSVKVFDVLGKQVIDLNPSSTEVKIDASSLKTGLYFARIESVSGIKTIKLIKN